MSAAAVASAAMFASAPVETAAATMISPAVKVTTVRPCATEAATRCWATVSGEVTVSHRTIVKAAMGTTDAAVKAPAAGTDKAVAAPAV